MLGRSALLAATNSENFGNWLGNYSDVSLLLRNGTTSLVPFDESPTPKVITAVGNASVTTAVARWNQGSGGSSLAFDGNGDYLTVGSNADFQFGTGDFTIEFWLYPLSLSNDDTILDMRAGSSSVPVIYWFNGLIYWAQDSVRINGGGLNLNQWSHIAVCRSGTSTRMFINENQAGNTFTDTINYAAGQVGIMGPAGGNSGHGYMDDLRITKGVARYETGTGANAGKMVFAGTNNLAVPNEFGELQTNSGPNPDPSYNSVSLLLRNGTPLLVPFDESPTPKVITAVGNAGISTAVFKYGTSSLVFDGSGDYLNASTSSDYSLGTGDFTVETWLYKNVNNPFMCVAGTMTASSPYNTKWQLFFDSPNGTRIRWWSDIPLLTSTSTLGTGIWYHVAVTRASGVLRLFVNGVLEAFDNNDPRNYTESLLWIGQVPENVSNRVWNGYLDDFRITRNFARYTSNFTPPPAELPNF